MSGDPVRVLGPVLDGPLVGARIVAGTDRDGDGTLDPPDVVPGNDEARAPLRDHLALVSKLYQDRMGNLPRQVWFDWQYLMAEARWRCHEFRVAQLELLIYSSATVDGWGTERMVEGLQAGKGGVKETSAGPLPTIHVHQNQPVVQAAPARKGLLGLRR